MEDQSLCCTNGLSGWNQRHTGRVRWADRGGHSRSSPRVACVEPACNRFTNVYAFNDLCILPCNQCLPQRPREEIVLQDRLGYEANPPVRRRDYRVRASLISNLPTTGSPNLLSLTALSCAPPCKESTHGRVPILPPLPRFVGPPCES